MALTVRRAGPGDEGTVAELIRELARSEEEESGITAAYAASWLISPGVAALLAEEDGRAVGLLSYSVRPNLYHAADSVLIEELVVRAGTRGRGVGGALMADLLRSAAEAGCAEVSVSTMPDNARAIAFYRKHGFVDEALFLERHLG